MTTPLPWTNDPPDDVLDADDAAAIAAAEAALAALAAEYPTYAAADLAALHAAFDRLWARFEGAPGPADCAQEAAGVFAVAHDIKGQGASFGYDLMTEVAGSLCELLRGRAALDLAEVEAAGAHIAALEDVLARGLTGDGGEDGRALLAALEPARTAARRA